MSSIKGIALALMLVSGFTRGGAIAAPGAGRAPADSAHPFAAPGETRPNFLLLLSDDQTFRALGCLKESQVRTPNLDRLARRGMLFTHCFNQGGWSGAVCIPSRTMLNTGRTLWESCGTNNQGLAPGAALWGETLGRAGYQTFMAGKWHLPDEALLRSFQSLGPLTGGFLPSTTNRGAAYFRPAAGNSWRPDDPESKGHWIQTNGHTIHSSTLIADAAIEYLRTNSGPSAPPFFMYVAFNAPHDPRQAPREFLEQYPARAMQVPPNFIAKHPFLIGENFEGRDEILAPYPRTPEIVQVHLQEYYAIIAHLDAELGRILAALEKSGRAANTIVVFTSDQGLAVGQHGLMGKQNLYDHSLRMPFIMAGPGIPRGRCDALFNQQSLFATTCEMAGIPVPATVQFPSLVPLLSGTTRGLTDALYAAFLNRQRAVRTERWKLIRTPSAGVVQLFDVQADPWETRNLADDREYAGVVAMLDRRLRTLMREMKDPLPPERLFGFSPVTRIGFGSCINTQAHPMLDRTLQLPFELFVLLGDNIYADTTNAAVMAEKYRVRKESPFFQALRKKAPLLATWDDHDFGANDAGASYPMKAESQRLFCDFMDVPADSPRRQREGIYDATLLGPPGRRVQIILLDTRYFRSDLATGDNGVVPSGGRYIPHPDASVTMLGEAQWSWLEEQLRQPAEVRIIASSIQFISEFSGGEAWANLPREKRRMLDLLRNTKANGVLFISGDRHWAELSRLDRPGEYPLYDLTSSALTEEHKRGTPTPNRYREGTTFHGNNVGLLTIDWEARGPAVLLQLFDVDGTVQIEKRVRFEP